MDRWRIRHHRLLFSFVFSGNAVLFLRRSVSLARAFAALLQKGTVWVSAYNDFGVSLPFGATRLGDGREGGPDVFGSVPGTSDSCRLVKDPSIQLEESC